MQQTLRAAIVQDAPVPFAIGPGIDRAVQHVEDAIDVGAQLVAFGEAFLGGYPLWLDAAPGAAIWDHPGTQELHALLMIQAIRRDDPRLRPLQELVDRSGTLVSIGGHMRVRSSLLNAQFLFRPERAPMIHRKLVPTHGERMIWARGDGSTLEAHEAEWGPLGQLISWEHWMPLTRAALHHTGEAVHVGAWQTINEMSLLASRHYAFEGRCFVLAAGTIQHRQDLLDGLERAGGNGRARDLLLGMPDGRLQHGGSAIIGPDGMVIAQSDADPDILMAEIDLTDIGRGLATLDVDGHYARPDVFELRIDRRLRRGIVDAEDGFEAA
jgi:predicted amidohydrolase